MSRKTASDTKASHLSKPLHHFHVDNRELLKSKGGDGSGFLLNMIINIFTLVQNDTPESLDMNEISHDHKPEEAAGRLHLEELTSTCFRLRRTFGL